MNAFAHFVLRLSSKQQKRHAAGSVSHETGGTLETPRRFPLRAFSLFWLVLLAGSLLLASGHASLRPQVGGKGGVSVAAASLCPVSQESARQGTDPSPRCLPTSPALQTAHTLATHTVVQATPTPSASASLPPFPQQTTNNFLVQAVLAALGNVAGSMTHWLGQALSYIIDWATSTLGFMWVTPAALTYKHKVVLDGMGWMLGLTNSVMVLLLVLGGYQCVLRTVLGEPRVEVFQFVLRVIVAGVIANLVSISLIPQLIELNNTLCTGTIGMLLHMGTGDFKVPFLGGLDWAAQPINWALFLLIELVMGVLLSLSMTVRLGLFLACYLLAPAGILFLSTDAFRSWGRLWCRLFFFSLFIQFLQVLVVAIGAAFISSFLTLGSQGSLSPTTVFVGIASLWLAFKLPQMLISPVLGAVYGDAQQAVAMVKMALAFVAV